MPVKHQFRDIVTVLGGLLIILFTSAVAWLAYPPVAARCGLMTPVVIVALGLLVHGLVSVLYIACIRGMFPLVPGTYEMDDVQFTLWKHYTVVIELGKVTLGLFFPVFVRSTLYRLFGVRTGKGTVVAGTIADPLLTTLEDRVVLGHNSFITCHVITDGRIVMHPVVIRTGATVGINAVVLPGTTIGEHAVVAPGAVVPLRSHIGAYELWGGTPAKRIKILKPCVADKPKATEPTGMPEIQYAFSETMERP